MKNGLRKALDQLRQSLSPTGISDAQLLSSFIAERDEAAFAALVRRYGAMVLGVCTRILRNPQDSEDAFQATFLALVQKARFVANRQAIASWLYTVAYRSAREVQIRNTRRQNRERQVAMRRPESKCPEPQDWRPVLDGELNRLPEKYGAPIILCDIEGLSRREAARQLHVAEGTLSSRLATARRKLAQRLSRHGVTLSGGALAVSLSEASASVPPALVGFTTKSALLVAAGQTAAVSASISLIMKGAAQAMFLAKLKPMLATVMALVLGAGTLAYCASGQTGVAAPAFLCSIGPKDGASDKLGYPAKAACAEAEFATSPWTGRLNGMHERRATADGVDDAAPGMRDEEPSKASFEAPASAYNALFDKVLNAVTDHFTVEYSNRSQGRIEAFPVTMKDKGASGPLNHLKSVPSIRQQLIVQITPFNEGGFLVEVGGSKHEVTRDKQLEKKIINRLLGEGWRRPGESVQ